jgi:neutral ceramidase
MEKLRLPIFLWAILFVLLLPAHAFGGELRVGAGKVSITPEAAVFPYLPSDGPSLNVVSGERNIVGVHDDIYARALVMDDGARRVALVVLEVTAVPLADEIAKAIAQEIGVPESNVMLAATHTHSVPLFSFAGSNPSPRERREIDRLKQGAVEAARQANAHLEPAQVVFARGQGWVNVNNGEQSGSRAGYDPLGPSDKSLDVVRFESPNGSPIALLVNYASHAEVMFRSVTRDNGYEVSGDLPGAVSRILEGKASAAPVVLFTSGAEADQLTIFKSVKPAGKLPTSDEGAGGWALLDALAQRLGESVLNVVSTMKAGTSQVHIEAASSTVSCPGQQIRIDSETHQVTKEDKPPVEIPLSMLKINDIVLAGVGGDVASAIGQHLKSASPLPDTTLVSIAGPYIGYIFSDASYVHPGHGITKSLLKEECADHAVVDGIVRMINGTTNEKH